MLNRKISNFDFINKIFIRAIAFSLLMVTFCFADDYNALEVSGVSVLKMESRIIENTDEAIVLENLKMVLIKYGYDINIFSTELGLVTGVYNKHSGKKKSKFLGALTMGLPSAIGFKDVPDEMYVTFLTKQVGANNDNVLIQGRFNEVQWDKLGNIRFGTGVQNSGVEHLRIYNYLAAALSKPMKEMK